MVSYGRAGSRAASPQNLIRSLQNSAMSEARSQQTSALSESNPLDRVLATPDLEIPLTSPRFSSRPQSLSARSGRSYGSSLFLDDIKHEVMVNYLYQQQCANLWVSDGSGEVEGVLLRKSWGQYMACPPQLGTTSLAVACAALNLQVCGVFGSLCKRLKLRGYSAR